MFSLQNFDHVRKDEATAKQHFNSSHSAGKQHFFCSNGSLFNDKYVKFDLQSKPNLLCPVPSTLQQHWCSWNEVWEAAGWELGREEQGSPRGLGQSIPPIPVL